MSRLARRVNTGTSRPSARWESCDAPRGRPEGSRASRDIVRGLARRPPCAVCSAHGRDDSWGAARPRPTRCVVIHTGKHPLRCHRDSGPSQWPAGAGRFAASAGFPRRVALGLSPGRRETAGGAGATPRSSRHSRRTAHGGDKKVRTRGPRGAAPTDASQRAWESRTWAWVWGSQCSVSVEGSGRPRRGRAGRSLSPSAEFFPKRPTCHVTAQNAFRRKGRRRGSGLHGVPASCTVSQRPAHHPRPPGGDLHLASL